LRHERVQRWWVQRRRGSHQRVCDRTCTPLGVQGARLAEGGQQTVVYCGQTQGDTDLRRLQHEDLGLPDTGDKDELKDCCLTLFDWRLNKHHGRAEGALLAL